MGKMTFSKFSIASLNAASDYSQCLLSWNAKSLLYFRNISLCKHLWCGVYICPRQYIQISLKTSN